LFGCAIGLQNNRSSDALRIDSARVIIERNVTGVLKEEGRKRFWISDFRFWIVALPPQSQIEKLKIYNLNACKLLLVSRQ
jgi:hypothetical protein